jgi:hypothetical protein
MMIKNKKKMELGKVLHYARWLLIAFFTSLICLEVYLAWTSEKNFDYRKTILLFTFIAIFVFKNKFTWILAIALFLWSLYIIIIKGSTASVPSVYEFTSSINFAIDREAYPKIFFFLHQFPVYFNFVMLLVFATYPVRRWYGISAKRVPKIKSYL